MAETRYSVSPIFLPKSFGPNPRENLRTLTPTQRAAKKCPSSWNATKTPRTIRNHHAFCNSNQTVSGDQVNAVNTVYAPSCKPSRLRKNSVDTPECRYSAQWHNRRNFHRMLKKAVQQGRSERRGEEVQTALRVAVYPSNGSW